jgi:hypothetical protein
MNNQRVKAIWWEYSRMFEQEFASIEIAKTMLTLRDFAFVYAIGRSDCQWVWTPIFKWEYFGTI